MADNFDVFAQRARPYRMALPPQVLNGPFDNPGGDFTPPKYQANDPSVSNMFSGLGTAARGIGNAVSTAGAAGASFATGGGVPEAFGPPDPPTAAQSAANTAAKAALQWTSGQDLTGGADFTPGQRATAASNDNAAWNAHVATVTQQLQNLGVPNAGAVLAQPQPGWDKAAGEAAINSGAAPGTAKRLNYGYGTEIAGMATNGSKRLNSFAGVGSGAVGADGSQRVLGVADPKSAYQAAQEHIQDTLSQAATLRSRGDLAGALQAKALENSAIRQGHLFDAIATHSFRAGQMTLEQQRLEFEKQKARPGLIVGNRGADMLQGGDYEGAQALKRASEGLGIMPAPYTAQPFTTTIDANTGRGKFNYFPSDLSGK